LDKAIGSQLLLFDKILPKALELQYVTLQITNELVNIVLGIENPLIHTGIQSGE